ncbi:MAG: substrate binding domain-containing protein [Burkholderiaceae bacterium]
MPFEQIAQGVAVRDLADSPGAAAEVTAPVALARQQIVPLLADFLRMHPQVRIELNPVGPVVVHRHGGFRPGHPPHRSPARYARGMGLVRNPVGAGGPRAPTCGSQGTPRSPQDLSAHNCLHYPRPQETPAWTLRRHGDGGEATRVTVQVGGSLAANNSEALRDAAMGGLGIALLPDFSAQTALRSGKLIQVLPDWQPVGPFAGHVYAIRPYSPHVPRAVSAFVDYLRGALAGGFAR